jgi:hypothetical protein
MSQQNQPIADAPTFGFLTLATPSDYYKAIGLALSLRVSNPGIPIAVACSERTRPLLEKYFDQVVIEIPNMRGFIHKVYLDKYSPFDRTMFFDSDVLVFKDVRPYARRWSGHGYTACGKYLKTGISTFGMDRARVLAKLGKPDLVVIDGAGHALFEKPACFEVFDFARHVSDHHAEYVGAKSYADEDVMDVVMTSMDKPPMPFEDFFSRYLSARKGTIRMDASQGRCDFLLADTGEPFSPCMMHFAANEAPLAYHFQLRRLFRKFDVDIPGFWRKAADDLYESEVKLPLNRLKRWLLRRA